MRRGLYRLNGTGADSVTQKGHTRFSNQYACSDRQAASLAVHGTANVLFVTLFSPPLRIFLKICGVTGNAVHFCVRVGPASMAARTRLGTTHAYLHVAHKYVSSGRKEVEVVHMTHFQNLRW